MKKAFAIIAAITISVFTLVAADQPVAKKLPTVPLISAACSKEIIVDRDGTFVRYECEDAKKWVWVVFTADLRGKLISLRVVMGDRTMYSWEVANGYDRAGLPIIADCPENGVNGDNTYTLDRRAWVRFYERHLRLPPIQVR
jgi:hypothetical protein